MNQMSALFATLFSALIVFGSINGASLGVFGDYEDTIPGEFPLFKSPIVTKTELDAFYANWAAIVGIEKSNQSSFGAVFGYF